MTATTSLTASIGIERFSSNGLNFEALTRARDALR